MSIISQQVGSKLGELTREFEIIAHNLANVNTTGYKRRSNSFSKVLMGQAASSETEGHKSAAKTTFDFSQGSPIETGRALDFALYGKGFFVIETPEGPLYSRNGIFRLNQNGQIVDSMGRGVAGEDGPILIPSDVGTEQINVSDDGAISANGMPIGKFKLVDFKDKEDKLVAVGANCFRAPRMVVGENAEKLSVKQGFKEGSNVQMIEELVDMIMVSRLYEANMKFLSTGKTASKSLLSVAMG